MSHSFIMRTQFSEKVQFVKKNHTVWCVRNLHESRKDGVAWWVGYPPSFRRRKQGTAYTPSASTRRSIDRSILVASTWRSICWRQHTPPVYSASTTVCKEASRWRAEHSL